MKVAVVGLGALGIAFATFLKNAGNTVYGITKPEYLKDFQSKSVKVSGIWGTHKVRLDGIFSDISQIKEQLELIIITVKSYDTEKVLKQIKPAVSENTLILIAQNGYGNYEKATRYYGKSKILLARVIFGSKLIDRTHAHITVNADDVRIGDPSKTIEMDRIIEVVKTINSAGIPASYAPDVYQILWDKILYNCALNPLGAILECSYGQLADNPETVKIMNRIIEEIFKTAQANNIRLKWDSPQEYIQHFYNNLIPPTKEHFPSMYYDLKSGKKTEIDALNGAIVKLAHSKGLSAPVNETITSLVKFKEESL